MQTRYLPSAKIQIQLLTMFVTLLMPCAVQAQTVTDSQFNNVDWQLNLNASSTAALNGWASGLDTNNGTLAPSRTTRHVFGVGSIILTHQFQPFTYNPSGQGAINRLNYSYDLRAYANAQSEGANVGYAILVAQGGNFFRSAFDLIQVNNTWQAFSRNCLTASDFTNLNTTSSTQTPDFSSNGSPIQFGYVTANSATTGTPHTKDSGIDNWRVAINPGCCCSTDNLVINGNFEAGNTGFNSQYAFNPSTTAYATSPGQYNIVTGIQALSISPNWIVADHTTCNTNSGNFLVVNGRTTQTGSRSIWRQTISVTAGREYQFCANFKNLPQSTFDIKPTVEVQFITSPNIAPTVVSVTNNACDWQLISTAVIPTNNSLTIDIVLNENVLGDGNDLALDDISLKLKPNKVNPNLVLVDIVATNISNTSDYNVSANPKNLPSGYGYYWEVCELNTLNICIPNINLVNDPHVTNPSSGIWWTFPLPCDFKGYNSSSLFNSSSTSPGIFTQGKRYMIRFGAWSDCEAWSESSWLLQYNVSLKKAVIAPMPQARQRPIPPVNARGKGISSERR